jgi:hypothetical protein
MLKSAQSLALLKSAKSCSRAKNSTVCRVDTVIVRITKSSCTRHMSQATGHDLHNGTIALPQRAALQTNKTGNIEMYITLARTITAPQHRATQSTHHQSTPHTVDNHADGTKKVHRGGYGQGAHIPTQHTNIEVPGGHDKVLRNTTGGSWYMFDCLIMIMIRPERLRLQPSDAFASGTDSAEIGSDATKSTFTQPKTEEAALAGFRCI